jgi:photosystem II stability/assembly factor-like uncharacterized protein
MDTRHSPLPATGFLRAILATLAVMALVLPLSARAAVRSPLDTVQAPQAWATLFQDDFEDGNADDWQVDRGWQVDLEGGNHVLSGQGHQTSAVLTPGHDWADYSFRTRIKLLDNAAHYSEAQLSYRASINGRYVVWFWSGGLGIGKDSQGTGQELAGDHVPHSFDTWYDLEIVGVEGHIEAYVDGALRLEATDSDPLRHGRVVLSVVDDSHVQFDDILVVGEPPPPAPPGHAWTRTGGPSGGLGYDVRIDPTDKNVMFVTDNPTGVNKSYDGGSTWVQRNEGISTRAGPSLDGIPVFCLTIDPNDPGIVWAGTQYARGIYKSTDGGETWTRKDNGVTEGNEISVRNFGVRPGNSDVVFAGAEITTFVLGIEFDKARGKIYKTEDGGENWRSVWEGDSLVRFVLFDPTNPSVLYASTGIFDREAANDVGVGVLKSTDGGENWFTINNGIPDSEGNRFVGFLEMHPTNPQVLFAATGMGPRPGGVYRTIDGGANWLKTLSGDVFTIVTISPSNPDVVYAGSGAAFYRSDDGGDTWQRFSKQNPGYFWGPPGVNAGFPISAVVDPDDPYTVFANNYNGGNFKSTDGGETWVNASEGYTGAHLHDIAIDADHPAIVYTLGRSGPFRSTTAGAHWAGIAFAPAIESEWLAVAVHPVDRRQVLISDEFSGLLWKSTDGGNTWRTVFNHPDAGDPCALVECRHGFRSIAYAPSNPDVVYAGMSRSRRTVENGEFPGPSFGMYRSTDGGENWGEINTGLATSLINIHRIAVHPTDPDVVYVGTWKDGVFKTTDGGQSWALKNNGLISADVRSLAIDPQNPQVVFAGLGEGAGVYKSTDGGESWGAVNTGLKLVCPSNLLPIGRVEQGLSLDDPPRLGSGADYYSVPWTWIWEIVIDPTDSQTVYAADHHAGVYLSTDGGASWLPINEGLSTRAVTAMAISSDGEVVYAATEGEGVFRLGTVAFDLIYLPLVLR